jgi:hypothetical protein
MRIIILLVMVLLPCAAFAGTNCRVVEYPDHYEAICDGDAEKTPSPYQRTVQGQLPVQEQTLAAAYTPEPEQVDVPIVRNELARLHAASWLKTRPSL